MGRINPPVRGHVPEENASNGSGHLMKKIRTRFRLFAATRRPASNINHGFPEEDLRTKGSNNPGYFPAWIGMQLEGARYCVVRKLGWGQFSTVWLVRDIKSKEFAALKIMTRVATSKLEIGESDEIAMLEKIASADHLHQGSHHLVKYYGTFEISGPQGLHRCVVSEVLGPSLDTLRFQAGPELRLPLPLLQTTIRQVLLGLDYLHTSCGIVHTDLKFDNIMFRLKNTASVVAQELVENPSKTYMRHLKAQHSPFMVESQSLHLSLESLHANLTDVVVADFGHSHWTHRHFKEEIQPAALRAPEVILGHPWNYAVDIWSIGCLFVELLVGFKLFPPAILRKEWDPNEIHLAQMTEVLGEQFPADMLGKSKYRKKYFKDDGSFIHSAVPREPNLPLRLLLSKWSSFGSNSQEVDAAVAFLKRCLRLRPEDRATAKELAEDLWLKT